MADPEDSIGFLRRGARPPTQALIAFVDAYRDRFGVEPICRTLSAAGWRIAASTYYASKTRPPSRRALRDAELLVEIERVRSDRNLGRGLYGARKVWHQLKREGQQDPRCRSSG